MLLVNFNTEVKGGVPLVPHGSNSMHCQWIQTCKVVMS